MSLEDFSAKEIREYSALVKDHSQNQIMHEVLSGESTFKQKVEEFYDANRLDSNTFRIEKEAEKFRLGSETPGDLLDILRGFEEQTPDLSDLAYKLVRESITVYNKKTLKSGTTIIGSFLLAGAEVVLGMTLSTTGNPYAGIPLLIGSIPTFAAGLLYSLKIYPKAEGSYEAFLDLIGIAKDADRFMKEYKILEEKELLPSSV